MTSYKVRFDRVKGFPVYGNFVVYADSPEEACKEVRDFIDVISFGDYYKATIETIQEFE